MAAITATKTAENHKKGRLVRFYGTSTANQSDTLSTDGLRAGRLICCTVAWTSAVTKNVTVQLISGISAGYNALLTTMAASAAVTVSYTPTVEFVIATGDKIMLTNDAGGSAITAAMTIYLEEL
jgi:hypothetical protein